MDNYTKQQLYTIMADEFRDFIFEALQTEVLDSKRVKIDLINVEYKANIVSLERDENGLVKEVIIRVKKD
jgi:hypothetical protein